MAEGATSLLVRLAAVWLSLRTRWLYILFAASFVFACGGFYQNQVQQRDQTPRWVSVLATSATLKTTYTIGLPHVTGNNVSPTKARSLQVFTSLTEWLIKEDLTEYPHIEAIDLFAPLSSDDVSNLTRFPKLQSLTITTTRGMSAVNLSRLAECQHLRRLAIRESEGYRTPDAITWPSQLEVLDIQGAYAFSHQRVEELSRLPKLHTLSVRLDPVHPTSQLPDDVRATLQTFPRLRTLYLQEMPQQYPTLVRETQTSLPALHVRPSSFDRNRIWRLPGLYVIASLWFAMLCAMLSPQFVTPQSVLMPGYRGPHVLMAILLLAAGLGLICVLGLIAGVDALTTSGLTGGVLAAAGSLALLFRRLDPGMPGFTQPFLVLPVFVFSLPLFQGALWLYPGEVDWILRGEQPGLCVMLTVVGIALAVATGRELTALYRSVEAAGRGGCPLAMFDTQGWQQWALTTRRESQRGGNWRQWITGSDVRLERATEFVERSFRGRRRLWRAGSESTAIRIAMLMTFACVFGVGVVMAVGAYVESSRPEPKFLIIGLGYAAFMMTYLPAILAYSRRPFLAMELLRPVSRQEWVQDWFVMFARDQFPAIVLSALSLVFLGWIGSTPAINHWIPIGLLFCGAWLSIWAGELWLLTLRPTVLTVVIFILVLLSLVPVQVMMFFGKEMPEVRLDTTTMLWALAVLSLIVGTTLSVYVRRRWLTWELG